MSRSGRLWRHVIINTRGTWLHGDPRGFRSRKHRIHSSGDYILYGQGSDAWTWSYRDGTLGGEFGWREANVQHKT